MSGESVQQGMLRLLEGADVEVPVGANSKNAMVPLATINTRNILFICGGAFPDLEEIIKQRLTKQTSIGFNAELKDRYDNDRDLLSRVTVEDLKKFGMIPEFLGRLPVIYTLKALDRDMLVKILMEPKNAILKQYQKLLELDEVQLEFDRGSTGSYRGQGNGARYRSSERCVQSSKSLCWILCMKFRRMIILEPLPLRGNTLKEREDPGLKSGIRQSFPCI